MTQDPTQMHKERKSRNYALAGVLVFFVVLIAVVTMVKIGGAS